MHRDHRSTIVSGVGGRWAGCDNLVWNRRLLDIDITVKEHVCFDQCVQEVGNDGNPAPLGSKVSVDGLHDLVVFERRLQWVESV